MRKNSDFLYCWIRTEDGNGITGIPWDLMTSGLTWSESGSSGDLLTHKQKSALPNMKWIDWRHLFNGTFLMTLNYNILLTDINRELTYECSVCITDGLDSKLGSHCSN